MSVDEVLFSSKSDEWRTPQVFLDRVREVSPIALDPCAPLDNPHWTDAPEALTEEDDGLKGSWYTQTLGLVYVNPPYSAVKQWVEKAVQEAAEGREIVLLVPARVDTKWFQLVWDYAQAVCFWKGRIQFVGGKSGAPFPSAIAYYGPQVRRFEKAFDDAGKVVRL